MAATVPFRIYDLVHKYGWDAMVRLTALGIANLAEAQVLFVDSGATNALDADDGYHGHTIDSPLATIDYAVGLCTASEQSIIIAAPGHAETEASAAALVTCDVAGVKILGLGEGTLRPTITLSTDTGAIAFTVTAANVVISNFRIVVTKDAVAKCVNVAASDCKLLDIEIADNADSTEAAIGILTTSAADRLHIERFKHNGFLAGNACTESISLVGVDRGVVKDCWFRGAFSTAAIQMVTTACSGIVVQNCIFENGTTALTLDVVDNATSKWSAVDCWDVVGGYKFSGGSGAALATDETASAVVVAANLDHLAGTAIADTSDPVNMAEVVDNSVLANVLTVEGDTSDYDRRYYSLQALAKILQLQMGYTLKSVPGSAMPIAIWYVDANIAASGDGKTPLAAFKTLAEAITACSDSVDDWVLVFDYSGGDAGTITIDKSFVHIIGNANPGMPYPRIFPASAAPGFTLGDAADRVEIANLVIGGGDQTVAAILFNGAAGSYGCHIHDCVIGRDATAPGLYGIHVGAGADAPYLVVENNRFYGADGAGIAAAGSAIRIEGNMTRGRISNNYIQDIGRTATPAIWLDGEVTNPQVENNRIKTDTDTGTGSAIKLGASVDDGWISGNVACDGKDAPANNPFVDAGSTNGWGVNYTGKDVTLPA